MSHKLVSLYIGDGEYYTRTDADAVIADLEKEIDKLQDKVTDLLLRDRNMALHFNNAVDDLVHNKYKRCLAMANWCCDACDKWMMRKAKAIGLGKDGVKEYHQARRKLFHYMRWQTRWIKIAEKFKEEK